MLTKKHVIMFVSVHPCTAACHASQCDFGIGKYVLRLAYMSDVIRNFVPRVDVAIDVMFEIGQTDDDMSQTSTD